MQPDMLASAVHALQLLLEPARLMFLFLGVLIGLAIGVLPGLSGIVGMAMLIPFTYNLDNYTAFALLLGMAAVITSSDFITAVLFGVPGHVGRGRDGDRRPCHGAQGRGRPRLRRRLCVLAAGGIVGALVLAVSIPVLRPIMLAIGSPELSLSRCSACRWWRRCRGSAPLKGLTAAGLGLMIAMVGSRCADRHAALDLRLALSVGRRAAGAGDARHLRAAGARRARGARASASPATTRPTSTSRANGRACATRCGTGGWCCAAACSAPRSARCRASARR